MAKTHIPWSIKGIDPDTRAVAKEKAKEAGMTLGEWISLAIKDIDPAALGSEEKAGTQNPAQPGQGATTPPPPTPMARPVTGITVQHLKELVDSVNRLNERIRVTERNGRETANGLNLGLTSVMERIKRIESAERPATSPSPASKGNIDTLKSLETALRQVVDQFESTSTQTLERVTSNEQAVSRLAQRIDAMDSGTSEAFQQMRGAIDHVTNQVQQTERTAKAVMLQARAAANSTDTEFVEQTGEKLRILGAEIKRSGDQIQSLEKLIAKLSSKIEASEHRSSEGIMRVSATLETLRQELRSFDEDENEEGAKLEAETALLSASEQASNKMAAIQQNFDAMLHRLEGVADPKGVSAAGETETKTEKQSETASAAAALSAKAAPSLRSAAEQTEEDKLKEAMSSTDDLLSLDDEEDFETIFGDPIDQDPQDSIAAQDSLAEKPIDRDDEPEALLEAMTGEETEALGGPARRALTAKQKQILAARARRKRLQEAGRHEEDASLDQEARGDLDQDDEDMRAAEPSSTADGEPETRRSRFEEMKRRYGRRDGLPVPMFALIGVALVAVLALAWFFLKDTLFNGQKPDQNITGANVSGTPAEGADGAAITPTNPGVTQPGGTTPPIAQPDMSAAKQDFNQAVSLLQESSRIVIDAGNDPLSTEQKARVDELNKSAFPLIRRAAGSGYAPAEYQLGEMFFNGSGTEKSDPAARTFFQSAATKGNVYAMYKLGAMNANGWGGEVNYDSALYWFEQSANYGFTDSMYNLGLLYMPELIMDASEIPATIPVDPAKSFFWLSLAGTRGDLDAANTAKSIAPLLTPETKEQIEARVATWTPTPVDPAVNFQFQG